MFRRRLWCGSRQEGEDISPFRFVLRKIAKNLGKLRPGAEAAFEGAMVEFSEVMVSATGGDGAVPANGAAPVFEEFAVVEAQVQGVRRKPGGANGGVPAREEQ